MDKKGGKDSTPALQDYYAFLNMHRHVKKAPESRRIPNDETRGSGTPTTDKSAVRAQADDTAAKRGQCSLCNLPVFSNEFRQCINGAYVHDECIAARNKTRNTGTRDTATCNNKAQMATMPTLIKKSKEASDDLPNRRGDCGICKQGVFTDQPRKAENNQYFHQECIVANKFSKLSDVPGESSCTNATLQILNTVGNTKTSDTSRLNDNGDRALPDVQPQDVTRRGECGACNKGVYSDQSREFKHGRYYHADCARSSNASSSVPTGTRTSQQYADREADAVDQTEGNVQNNNIPLTKIKGCKDGNSDIDSSGPPARRGECGICTLGVYTNQLRKFEHGKYYHDECLSFGDSNTPMGVPTEGIRVEPLVPLTARVQDDLPMTTVRFSHDVVNRGTCGICNRHVLTNQLRTYENGQYFHDDCLFAVISEKLAKLNVDPEAVSVAITGGQACREDPRLQLLDKTVQVQEMRQTRNMYSIADVAGERLSSLDCFLACADKLENDHSRENSGPSIARASTNDNSSITTAHYDGSSATSAPIELLCFDTPSVNRRIETKERDSAGSKERPSPSKSLEECFSALTAGRSSGNPLNSPSKTLVDCCSVLATKNTPRFEALPLDDLTSMCLEDTKVNETFKLVADSADIIPDEFLRQLRRLNNSSRVSASALDTTDVCHETGAYSHETCAYSPILGPHQDASALGACARVGSAGDNVMDKIEEGLTLEGASRISSSSDRDALALLDSMTGVCCALTASAHRVEEKVMSPRKILAQTARLEETNGAQEAVFKSLQSVLDHVSHVESSLSDDELAHVLQELANIAKSWGTDRNLLVADLAQARAECEEMKTLALTACQEATGVVERARSQAKSRLEAKRKAKADNKLLQHKNLVLMNTCTALTQQHMADVHQMADSLEEAKNEAVKLRVKMEQKLEKIALILMKVVVLDAPFRQWERVMHANRWKKLDKSSQDICDEAAAEHSLVLQEGMRARERLREEMLEERASEANALRLAHQEELERMRLGFEANETRLRLQHERLVGKHETESRKYQDDYEMLCVRVHRKSEAFAEQRLLHVMLAAPLREWAILATHSKRIDIIASRLEPRARLLTLTKCFLGWEVVLPKTCCSNTALEDGDDEYVDAQEGFAGGDASLQTPRGGSVAVSRQLGTDTRTQTSLCRTLSAEAGSKRDEVLEAVDVGALCEDAPPVFAFSPPATVFVSVPQSAPASVAHGRNTAGEAAVRPLLSSTDPNIASTPTAPLIGDSACAEEGQASKTAKSSPSVSFVANTNLFQGRMSAASADHRSVSSSCMRSSSSTRSSVWASNTRVGIGAYFQRSDSVADALQVKRILPNSPAAACKLMAVGDYIIAVDGELVSGKSLSQLAEKVLGAPNSMVECSFRSKESSQLYSVSLVRGVGSSG